MKILGKEVSIDEAINFAKNEEMLLKRRSNNMLLSDFQVEVLKRYGIDYNKYGNIKDLLFEIEEYLNEEYNLELDNVGMQLAELVYYNYTNK